VDTKKPAYAGMIWTGEYAARHGVALSWIGVSTIVLQCTWLHSSARTTSAAGDAGPVRSLVGVEGLTGRFVSGADGGSSILVAVRW